MEIESCKIGSDGLKVKECPKLEKVTLKGVREEWDEAALADIKEAVLSLDGGARLFSDPSLHAPRADIPGAQPSKASAKGNSSKQSKSCVIL